jgi:hypothetical protein
VSEAIEVSVPPKALLKEFNPVLHVALRTPLGAALKEFMVMSFTGRKSGKRFSVPVSAHHLDGDLYALIHAIWKHNFTAGHPTDVLYLGRTTTMHGQLIKDPATVADISHCVATDEGAKRAQRTMGLKFRDGTVPSVEDFVAAAKREGLVAIKLTPT